MFKQPIRRLPRIATIGATALCVLAASACSGASEPAGDNASSSPSEHFSQQIHDMLPQAVKDRGYILNGVSAASPPVAYLDENGEYVGYESEIRAVLEDIIGLEIRVPAPVNFDEIVPGLSAKRFDMANLNDTVERERVLDFVDLLYAGTGFVVKAGNPSGVSESTLCGLTVATEKGSVQIDTTIPALSTACEGEGKAPIATSVYPDNNAAVLAMNAGRADAIVLDAQTAAWIAQNSPGLEFVETEIKNGIWGYGFLKGSELVPVFKAAAQTALEQGLFDEIFTEYEITSLRLDEIVVNGAASAGN